MGVVLHFFGGYIVGMWLSCREDPWPDLLGERWAKRNYIKASVGLFLGLVPIFVPGCLFPGHAPIAVSKGNPVKIPVPRGGTEGIVGLS
jgi:hypothetical protein